MPSNKSSQRFAFGAWMEKWWFKLLEVVAFIVLFFHLLPEDKYKAWGQSGIALVYLIGFSMISLLVINYLLTFGYAKEIKRREDNFSIDNQALKNEIIDLSKKSRYADTFQMLNKAFKNIHSLTRRDEVQEAEFKEAFKQYCEMLAKVFGHIVGQGNECHVCMKMCVYPNDFVKSGQIDLNVMEVKTIVRSVSISPLYDRTDVDTNKIKHPIVENTDFEFVMTQSKPFFSNNLCSINLYKNSSFKKFCESYIFFDEYTTPEHRDEHWPLAYRSSMVAPILPGIPSDKDIIYGFVCVDAAKKNSFDESYDKEILIGCCDGIYNAFRKYLTSYILKP